MAGFESKYGMTSGEFIRRYNRCEFEEENLELLDWAGYYYIAGRMDMLDKPQIRCGSAHTRQYADSGNE